MPPTPKHYHAQHHDRVPPVPSQHVDDIAVDEVDGAHFQRSAVAEVASTSAPCCESESTQTDVDASFASATCESGPDDVDDWGPDGDEWEANLVDRLTRRLLHHGVEEAPASGRRDRSTQTAKDPLAMQTEKLAFDVVFHTLGRRPPKAVAATAFAASSSVTSEEVSACLRRTVSRMLDRHALVFNSMVTRLGVSADDGEGGRATDLDAGFRELSGELFFNGEVSWSKIVALFAFGARLAQHCQERDMGGVMVMEVAEHLAKFAVERLTPFLRQHGGWATLCDAFPEDSDYESSIWKALLVTGFGLATVATFLAMQK